MQSQFTSDIPSVLQMWVGLYEWEKTLTLPTRDRPYAGYCRTCGIWRRSLHRDHIVPRAAGGTADVDNIQYLCANCHQEKTYGDHQDHPEWAAKKSAAMMGKPKSAAYRAAISAGKKGKPIGPFSPEHCAALSAAGKGRIFSPEHRAALSASWKGRSGKPHSAETRAAMSTARTGTHLSLETRDAISAARQGKHPSLDARAAMSAAQKGKHLSPEHRAAISAARRAGETMRKLPEGSPLPL